MIKLCSILAWRSNCSISFTRDQFIINRV
jgi:hypothetical protein